MIQDQLKKNLKYLDGKRLTAAYFVDYTPDRLEDRYEPWLIALIFENTNYFLTIEGDFDAEHIRIEMLKNTQLSAWLVDQNSQSEQWKVYESKEWQTLHKLLDKILVGITIDIDKIAFADKRKTEDDEFTNLIALHFQDQDLVIYETGLGLIATESLASIRLEYDDYKGIEVF